MLLPWWRQWCNRFEAWHLVVNEWTTTTAAAVYLLRSFVLAPVCWLRFYWWYHSDVRSTLFCFFFCFFLLLFSTPFRSIQICRALPPNKRRKTNLQIKCHFIHIKMAILSLYGNFYEFVWWLLLFACSKDIVLYFTVIHECIRIQKHTR